MKRTGMSTAIALACGSAAPAMGTAPTPAPEPAPFGTEAGEMLGHIYINAATGERIVTRTASPVPARKTESYYGPLWIASGGATCPGGAPTGQVGLVDQPDLDPSDPMYTFATGAVRLDWGDVFFNSVVDTVRLVYYSAHDDPSAEGVEGFGATWHWFDIDNGEDTGGNRRLPLHSITLTDLPGGPGGGVLGGWEITLDLLDGFDEEQLFKLGDTQGDPGGASYYNHSSGTDLDGDGLHDFSYGVEFHQPGTVDFNGDGVPDGDPSAAARTGVRLVTPPGTAVPIPGSPTDQWTVDVDDPCLHSQGMEDAFVYLTRSANGDLEHAGRFWYDGFSCAESRPYAQAFIEMVGYDANTPNPCNVDVNDDGLVNFFDIQIFIGAFNSDDSLADWNDDGQINFFDIHAYMNDFNAGCP